jgi:predicted component of type VI protein secretion system
VLRNLENKIAGLVEGTFSRAFRSEVRPVEIARKLAREMEEHKASALSHTYVPNEYRVFLSPRDRARFADYEDALASELAGYLLEHARRERLTLASKPVIAFETADELGLGEFGIQTRTVRAPEDEPVAAPQPADQPPAPQSPASAPAPVPAEPADAEAGRTMVYGSSGRIAEPLEEQARMRQATALIILGDKRIIVGSAGATLGRSRQCDVVVDDPNVSRTHAELRPRGGSWVLTDLGSTNGSSVNGRRIDAPTVVRPGDEIELGTATMKFELQ